MKELSTISVPRHIGRENPQFICFCDASEKAYVTAIFLKTSCEDKAEVNLLFSKSINAPKKEKSYRDSNCWIC